MLFLPLSDEGSLYNSQPIFLFSQTCNLQAGFSQYLTHKPSQMV